jgi:predicted Zn-ribbon and HTH transcriptional regulator
MSNENKTTRELWLQNAVDLVSPIFKNKGYTIPKVQVSCGFPSTGNKSKHVGQCWGKSSTNDGTNQLFISPVLDEPVQVLDTLVHELVHAVDDCIHHHGPEFKKIATDVGLQGLMREASAGPWLLEQLTAISRQLGKYPHSKINLAHSSSKKTGPRPRAKCKKCGYEVTPLKKWLHMGPPLCPKHTTEMEPIGDWEEAIASINEK